MPKFNAYFRYICVYKIDVYYLRLLHLISIHTRYCFVPLNDIYETEPLGNAPLYICQIWSPKTNEDFENDPPVKWSAPLAGNKWPVP